MVEVSLLVDLGLIIIAATIVSLAMKFLRQPLVLGYVIAGFIVGPSLLKIVGNAHEVEVLSELGIAFMLFVVGLELDVKKIRQVGGASAIIGFLQVSLTFALGFGVSTLLGFPPLTGFYIGLAVAFSSTMVVIKLLADNKELESLHGQLVLGIMLVQDILAVFALSLLPSLQKLELTFFGMFILKILVFIIVLFIVAKFVIPLLLRYVQHNAELLFLLSLTMIFAFGYLATYFELSIAIGAFLAGLALSSSPLHLDIGVKIQPLRDFFMVMFFVTFGMQVSFDNFSSLLIPVIALILVSTVGKAMITFTLLRFFKYGARTSFLTAVQKAQVSEFSLVLVTVGLSLGHISAQITSLVTIAALITIVMTPYVIGADDKLFAVLARIFPSFKADGVREESLTKVEKSLKGHVVVFGFHKMTPSIIRTLQQEKRQFVIVDHNPEKVRKLIAAGINAACGSIENTDVHEKIALEHAKVIISTIAHPELNTLLLHDIKERKGDGLTILTAATTQDALDLYAQGADYVILPESLGGEKVSNYLVHLTPSGIKEWGQKHIAALKEEQKDSVNA